MNKKHLSVFMTMLKSNVARAILLGLVLPYLVIFLFAYFNKNILYSVHLFRSRLSFAIDLFSNDLFQTFKYF